MSHSFAAVWLHIVFGTKNRLPFLHDSIHPELHAYVTTVLKNLDCPALMINSVDDHLHALARLSRRHSIERVLEGMKANSSRWLKTKGGQLRYFQWQGGYGAFSSARRRWRQSGTTLNGRRSTTGGSLTRRSSRNCCAVIGSRLILSPYGGLNRSKCPMPPPSGLGEETHKTNYRRAGPHAHAWGYFRAPSGLFSCTENNGSL